MRAKELSLSNFRNIESQKIEFSPGITFLLGDNAQGKTNVLEALYLFARGKSFRGALDKEMTHFKREGYSLTLTYEKEDREESLFVSAFGKEKVRKKNGILLEKRSELVGNFRAVLFSPDDLQMVKGAPSERRRFLDIAISQCYPVYLSVYARYQKNLEERNALLKAMQKGFFFDEEMLSVYSENLSILAAEIYLYRRAYVEKLKVLHAEQEATQPGEPIAIDVPAAPIEEVEETQTPSTEEQTEEQANDSSNIDESNNIDEE